MIHYMRSPVHGKNKGKLWSFVQNVKFLELGEKLDKLLPYANMLPSVDMPDWAHPMAHQSEHHKKKPMTQV